MKNNQNIVIIGGAGYIGSVVTDFFLKKNYFVKSVDNLTYRQKVPFYKKNFYFYNLDISKKEKIEKIIDANSIVILLAGLVGDPITKKYPQISKKINENYITQCIDICFKKKIKHLIFVSTCSNYGITKSNKMVDEDSKLNPLSIYAKSKIKIEKYLKIKSKTNKIKITILRFATAFGISNRMRFDLTVNQFVREIFLKNNLEVYDSGTWRPYCHVKDFAGAIYKSIISKQKKLLDIYNVGSNANNFTKEQLIKKIQKYIEIKKIDYVNKKSDYRNYKVNFNKMKKKLNFTPKYSIDYGIKEILHAMKKKKYLKLKDSNDSFGNYRIKK
jgi:nucleoside-diphosphate-sugar epimerase